MQGGDGRSWGADRSRTGDAVLLVVVRFVEGGGGRRREDQVTRGGVKGCGHEPAEQAHADQRRQYDRRSGKGEKEGQVVASKSTSRQEVACSSLLLGRELILGGGGTVSMFCTN